MRRFSVIFVAICMVLIAGSLGAALYLGLKVDGLTSAIVALATLTGMALFNTVSGRLRDRGDLGDQIADLSRGTGDLARQVAEISRRLNAMENRVETHVDRARGAAAPIAAEIGELGNLVRQIADTVATHEAALQAQGAMPASPSQKVNGLTQPVYEAPLVLSETDAITGARRFRGMTRESVGELIAKAADSNRIDLYLQPIVTLPQRKVRYYEAMSRLRTEEGDIIPAGEFIEYAEAVGLMPKIDNLLVFRCVQVTRRLQLKSRDVGLFCNISASTLLDSVYFKQFLDFIDANRALAGSLIFEFTQKAYRAFGPMEHESLSALADFGFRFSMDHVADLRMEPKELADRYFRFLKVPAKLLLNKASNAQSDIHPADLADLLAQCAATGAKPPAALLVELPAREIGGRLAAWGEIVALSALAHDRGIMLHMDGARLWEARECFAPKSLAEVCAPFDSVYVSFYKGIGAIAGAIMLGPRIGRRFKRDGGGPMLPHDLTIAGITGTNGKTTCAYLLAQALVLCGKPAAYMGTLVQLHPLVASAAMRFDAQLAKMPAYRARALELAVGLSTIAGIVVDPQPPQVNLFHVHFDAPPAALTAARDQIASEDGAWLAQRIAVGKTPGWSSTEIYVGDNLLLHDNSTVVPLFARLIELAHSHARPASLEHSPMRATT